MNVYVAIVLNIFFWCFISKYFVFSYGEKIKANRDMQDSTKKISFILFTSVPLILITGLRHNMGTDYVTYQYNFERRIKEMSWTAILKGESPGFNLIQKIVGIISNYNTVFFMTVLAIITVSVLYYEYYKYTEKLWLAVFLTVTIGGYYTSFNTTRQYLAGVLFMICAEFIYQKKPVKYIVSVLLLATIHESALLMIPMYWILTIKWKSKRDAVINFAIFIVIGFFMFYSDLLVSLITRFIYMGYSDREWTLSLPLIYLTRPLVLLIVGLFYFRNIDFSDTKESCWFNSALLFFVTYVMSFKFYMSYRMTYYFVPLAIIFTLHMIEKIESKKNRLFWEGILIGYALIANIWGQFGQGYAFYWENWFAK